MAEETKKPYIYHDTPTQRERTKKQAHRDEITASELIRRAIEDYLRKERGE